jgi:hypothetical protein
MIGAKDWTERDGSYNYEDLFDAILRLFEDPDSPWAKETLQWYQEYVSVSHVNHISRYILARSLAMSQLYPPSLTLIRTMRTMCFPSAPLATLRNRPRSPNATFTLLACNGVTDSFYTVLCSPSTVRESSFAFSLFSQCASRSLSFLMYLH